MSLKGPLEALRARNAYSSSVSTLREWQGARPRSYQVELVEKIVLSTRNMIVFLPTGSGKTMVAFMAMVHALSMTSHKYIVFLATSTALAEQQCRAFKDQSKIDPALVELFYGGHMKTYIHISGLKAIFVTPDAYINMLKQRRCKLEDVALLVFDEVHNARNNHPYSQLMGLVGESTSRPRVLGLSASPGEGKTLEATISSIRILCGIMDAQLITPLQPSSIAELTATMTPAKQEVHHVQDDDHKIALLSSYVWDMGAESQMIVFTKQRDYAGGLASYLQELLGNTMRVDVLVGKGDMTAAQQLAAARAFNSGQVRVLVATSVVEEGIDIQGCDYVIRYHETKTAKSFIQSRGRARHKKAQYILFVTPEEQGDIEIAEIREKMMQEAVQHLCREDSPGIASRATSSIPTKSNQQRSQAIIDFFKKYKLDSPEEQDEPLELSLLAPNKTLIAPVALDAAPSQPVIEDDPKTIDFLPRQLSPSGFFQQSAPVEKNWGGQAWVSLHQWCQQNYIDPVPVIYHASFTLPGLGAFTAVHTVADTAKFLAAQKAYNSLVALGALKQASVASQLKKYKHAADYYNPMEWRHELTKDKATSGDGFVQLHQWAQQSYCPLPIKFRVAFFFPTLGVFEAIHADPQQARFQASVTPWHLISNSITPHGFAHACRETPLI